MRKLICSVGFIMLVIGELFSQTVNIENLYGKSWFMTSVTVQSNTHIVNLYERGKSSVMNFDGIITIFNSNGTRSGVNVDGESFKGSWQLLSGNKILIEGDKKPCDILKLNSRELILTMSQQYTSPFTNISEEVVTQTMYVVQEPLPVKLVSFEASLMENFNSLLIWTTSEEKNSEYFAVEHSVNAKEFTEVGKVMTENSNLRHVSYSFVHINSSSQLSNYYRLKMVDSDGSFTYSGIRKVSIIPSKTIIYPNPVSDELNIINENGNLIQSISIIDFFGKELHKFNEKPGGKVTLKDLPAGHFFVIIRYANGVSTVQKITKMP